MATAYIVGSALPARPPRQPTYYVFLSQVAHLRVGTLVRVSGWDAARIALFFSADGRDAYGEPVNPPAPIPAAARDLERCRAAVRYRMLLGCRHIETCAACMVQSSGEPIVQCDQCERWYHLHCQTVRSFELSALWECRACVDARTAAQVPVAPVPVVYVCPVITPDAQWRSDVAAALQKGMTLEQRYWTEAVDNTSTFKSLSCPFSATATEGPIGVLKALHSGNEGRRVECMLRAMLTARRYDIAISEIEDTIPLAEHVQFVGRVARTLLVRDSHAQRSRERGAAVLVVRDAARESEATQAAKRQRVEQASSQERLDSAADVQALTRIHGTGKVLGHQAHLWGGQKQGRDVRSDSSSYPCKSARRTGRTSGEGFI